MALETAFYKVTKEIAIRSGVIDGRYRTLDGFFILDNKDLSRIRFTPDEYINGLEGVEKISENEAETLIAKGGFKMGLVDDEQAVEEQQEIVDETPSDETVDEEQQNVDETEDVTNENQEEE